MSKMSEDIWYAGSDARPPMLDRTDFESWQQRIRLYCLGKDNGENIMKSITEGPFQMGTFIQTPAENSRRTEVHFTSPELQRVFTDLSSEGNESSELTKNDRESQLYDEFERFCQIKGETIHVYYVRFSKLINDMRNIKMTMSRMQLNSKFVNNMLPEWSRFITEQHEVHANENRMMMERFIQPTDDPLALVSNASNQTYPTQSYESPQFSNQPSLVDNCQMDTGSTSTDNLIESLTNTLALLRTSSNARNKATVQDDRVVVQDLNPIMFTTTAKESVGHIARECPQPKRPQDSDYFKDKMLLMNAHENGAVLDEEQLLFLTGEQVTNFDDDIFEADQCDAFDL
ncbi:hypothetical protein Tco_0127322 [Tanacetum coccineum]